MKYVLYLNIFLMGVFMRPIPGVEASKTGDTQKGKELFKKTVSNIITGNRVKKVLEAAKEYAALTEKLLNYLKSKDYQSIITSQCKSAAVAFQDPAQGYYGKRKFANMQNALSTTNILEFGSQQYYIIKSSIYDDFRARDIAAKEILSNGKAKDNLIFPEDCVYDGEAAMFIYKNLAGLDVTLVTLKDQFLVFNKKLNFAINLLSVYKNLEMDGCLHDNTLLDAIVVDSQNIEKVYLRKFYWASYEAIIHGLFLSGKNFGVCELQSSEYSQYYIYSETRRVVWILIIIQNYLFPLGFAKPYNAYVDALQEKQLSKKGSLKLALAVGAWCSYFNGKTTDLSEEDKFSKVLCKYYDYSTKYDDSYYESIIADLQKLLPSQQQG